MTRARGPTLRASGIEPVHQRSFRSTQALEPRLPHLRPEQTPGSIAFLLEAEMSGVKFNGSSNIFTW